MSNNLRTLNNVVSIDGWIAEFDDQELATVHIDIGFREGVFGAQDTDQIRFRIKLKRAELLLAIPNGQPIIVKRKTIARSTDDFEGKRTRELEGAAEASAKGELTLSATPKASLTTNANVEGRANYTASISETFRRFSVQHFKSDCGGYGWEICNHDGKAMTNSPWDANDHPRFAVKRSAPRNADGDLPHINVTVRCRREDIEISALEIKDEEKQSRFKKKPDPSINIKAAEQMIKERIIAEGFLKLPNLAEPTSDVIVAEMLIMEEME